MVGLLHEIDGWYHEFPMPDVYKRQVLLPSAILLLQSARSGENLSYFGVMKRHGLDDLFERLFQIANPVPVSYTHLDVYKRQDYNRQSRCSDVPGLFS